MKEVMSKLLKSTFAFLLLATALTFAGDKEEICENKLDQLKDQKKSCLKMRGKPGFKKCVAKLKKEKAKYDIGCKNVSGGAGSITGQIKRFGAIEAACEKDGYKSANRCAVSI